MAISLSDVEHFLREKGAAYRILTDEILDLSTLIKKQLGSDVVRTIYSRGTKQSDAAHLLNKDLKAPEKILKALKKLGSENVLDVTDVTGLTVVVHYPDQIALFVDRLIVELAKKRIVLVSNTVKKDGGYYATHVLFKSNHARHRNFHCEVQVKTMLHDAWAAKTHDLTYKPQGKHDPRLGHMMNLFADALQSIEVQSETLRDMIEERWVSENGWRQAVQKDTFSSIPVWLDAGLFSEEAATLLREIEANQESLGDCEEDDDILQEMSERVDLLCESSLLEGYLLQTYLYLVRNKVVEQIRARDRARQWLACASSEYRAKRVPPAAVWSVPTIFYVCGDLRAAINACEQLISEDALDERSVQLLQFNLANYLIEEAYFALPIDMSEQADLRERIEGLIAAASPLRTHDESAFHDTLGMLEISFSQEPAELRKAIDLIHKGIENVPESEKDVANSFYELNIRLAWRRLLDAESRQSLANRAAITSK